MWFLLLFSTFWQRSEIIKFPWDAFPGRRIVWQQVGCLLPAHTVYQSAILCNNFTWKISFNSKFVQNVVCVHFLGLPCRLNSLLSIAVKCRPIKICLKCVMFNVNTKRVVNHQYCMMPLASRYPGPPVFMSQVIYRRQWNVKPGNEFLRNQPCQVDNLQQFAKKSTQLIVWNNMV